MGQKFNRKVNNKKQQTNKGVKTTLECMADILNNKSKNYAELQGEMFKHFNAFNI